jgi:hypothetical protein
MWDAIKATNIELDIRVCLNKPLDDISGPVCATYIVDNITIEPPPRSFKTAALSC